MQPNGLKTFFSKYPFPYLPATNKFDIVTTMKKLLLIFLGIIQSSTPRCIVRSQDKEVILSDHYIRHINKKHSALLKHPYCSVPFRFDTQAVQRELEKIGAKKLSLKTHDHITVEAYHLKKSMDTLLIAAPGFPGEKEIMINLAAMFPQYDLLLFDFRWANSDYFKQKKIFLHPYRSLIDDCIKDVRCILDYAHSNHYKQIIGLGTCYSAGLFPMAQEYAQQNKLPQFNKLILDSCWLSLHAFADNWIKDPYLTFRWGKGGAPIWLKRLMQSFIIHKPLYSLSKIVLPSITISNTLKKLMDTPLLFIHGQKDPLISIDKFEQLWTSAAHLPRSALITPHGHNNHDTKALMLYTEVCTKFIQDNIDYILKESKEIPK